MSRKKKEEKIEEKLRENGENVEKEKVKELELALPFGYRLLIRFLIVGLIFLGCCLFLQFKCKIKKIEVVGNTWYEDSEITAAFQTTKFDDFSIFLKLHYMFFEDYPQLAFVEQFKLDGDGFDTMTIKVYEKKIVGCIRIMNDYMYFDKDGFLVASRIERENGIPLVEGLDFSQATVNSELNVSDSSVFAAILEITQLIDKYEVPVDRIEFDEFLKVTLYCTDGNEIFLGKQSSYTEIMQAIPGILKAAEGKESKYRLDMSAFDHDHTNIPAEFIEEETTPTPTPTAAPEKKDEETGEQDDEEDEEDDWEEEDYDEEDDEEDEWEEGENGEKKKKGDDEIEEPDEDEEEWDEEDEESE